MSAPARDFGQEIAVLRVAAHQQMQAPANAAAALALLQTLRQAEFVCARRYTALAAWARRRGDAALRQDFQEKASDERRHMALLGARIIALGGTPAPTPRLRGKALAPEDSLLGIVANNLLAERNVLKLYRAVTRKLPKRDKESRSLLQALLADEQRHIMDMPPVIF